MRRCVVALTLWVTGVALVLTSVVSPADSASASSAVTLVASVASVASVTSVTSVTRVSVGESHSCALTTAGGVDCWGRNYRGELGNVTARNS